MGKVRVVGNGTGMPQPKPQLTKEDLERFARDVSFARSDARRVGAEIEFITVPSRDPSGPVDLAELQDTVRALSLDGSVTWEPGGQLEIVSGAYDDVSAACGAIARDLRALTPALRARGYLLSGSGLDPFRPERRVLRAPRYDAMEAFFDMDGLSGRIMMTRTASVQVNLDFGGDPAAAWARAHRLGAAMAAAFANSPLWCGVPSGWRSTRLSTWRGIDRTRTSVVDGDGPETWARYVMNARVMLIRRAADVFVPVLRPFTFAQWMADGHEFGFPSFDDLAYHCTTLFPPIRPRGWLELRMCDALPDPWWKVPVAVWWYALYEGIDVDCSGLWTEAARDGLSHPVLARAARAIFDDVVRVMPAGELRDVVGGYTERWVARGRTPADDILESSEPFELERRPVGAAWI
ncbi:MAG: glutamate-cysteine ligase family protein [Actinomycetota bacterium]